MKLHTDLAGNLINVGDYVVYAAAAGRSPILKYGRVVALASGVGPSYTREEVPKIKVLTLSKDWGSGTEVQADGRPITLGYLDRVLVIPSSAVPESARALLGGES